MWKSRIRDRQRLVRQLEKQLIDEIRKAEQSFRARMGSSLAGLKTDAAGNLKATAGNIAYANRLGRLFDRFSADQRESGIIDFVVRAVRKVLKANRRYFNAMTAGGPHEEVAKRILESLGYVKGRVKPGSWLDEISRFNPVRVTLMQQVQSAILAGLSAAALGVGIAALFRSGILRKFFRRNATEIFVKADRATQNAYAKKLKLNHGFYSGTIKDNTRKFCSDRVQRVYTRAVINAMNDLKWAGKIEGTDVKMTCGGYRCRHHWSWVTPMIAESLGPINTYNE